MINSCSRVASDRSLSSGSFAIASSRSLSSAFAYAAPLARFASAHSSAADNFSATRSSALNPSVRVDALHSAMLTG